MYVQYVVVEMDDNLSATSGQILMSDIRACGSGRGVC